MLSYVQTYKRLTTALLKANRWEVHCLHWQRRISLLSLTHIISIPNSENVSSVFCIFFVFLFLELLIGLEPTTYWLQISCSTNWATVAFISTHIISKCFTPSITLQVRFVKRVEKPRGIEWILHIFSFLYILFSVYTKLCIYSHVLYKTSCLHDTCIAWKSCTLFAFSVWSLRKFCVRVIVLTHIMH